MSNPANFQAARPASAPPVLEALNVRCKENPESEKNSSNESLSSAHFSAITKASCDPNDPMMAIALAACRCEFPRPEGFDCETDSSSEGINWPVSLDTSFESPGEGDSDSDNGYEFWASLKRNESEMSLAISDSFSCQFDLGDPAVQDRINNSICDRCGEISLFGHVFCQAEDLESRYTISTTPDRPVTDSDSENDSLASRFTVSSSDEN